MEIGDFIKVVLPQERPWAMVTDMYSPNKVHATIDNFLLYTDEHGYRYGDEILLERIMESNNLWKPINKV